VSHPLRKDFELRVTANPMPAALAYGWCRRGAAAFLLLIPQAATASTGAGTLALWSIPLALLAGLIGGFLLGRRRRPTKAITPADGMTVAPAVTTVAADMCVARKTARAERPSVRVLTHGENQPDIDMVESVREVIFRTDDTLRLIFLNQAWGKLSGYAVRRCLGKPLIDYLHPDERERAGQVLHDVLHGLSSEAEFEFRLRTRGGEIRWVEVTCRPVGGADGVADGLAGTIDDISVRKVAELTLRNLNQELEARVRLRTAELEASNRELEAFSYSVSHDLRSPLRAIDGFARIVEQELEGHIEPNVRAYLDRIRKATERMAELIDALIQLATLTRQPLKKETFDLSDVARQIIDQLTAEEPGRQVEFEITQGLIVTADRGLMHVVLDNLLRNAWKFTAKQAKARIVFRAERTGGRRVFCVEDNGAGFDMEHAGNLFRPFHRLHAPEEFPGTGIGLATVQRIVQRHEGSIRAESRPGEGARFLFTLGN